ncbi:colanic acid degradation [Cronobacter phage vB_CsaM_GAP32]|uniref:Colanic acid-degrading protein n=1 Tax=Cronobacter phage vB_CsaM_GAP32 TaxID=1141136 RepID=K4F6L0_9CAUD|nr:colanic acid degradation [Cronobacter phage vB_CsaM_GAP32]AFC21578.1 colanic acid-degrading protein [Cronobacter phage vB_CsaM_GAP32]
MSDLSVVAERYLISESSVCHASDGQLLDDIKIVVHSDDSEWYVPTLPKGTLLKSLSLSSNVDGTCTCKLVHTNGSTDLVSATHISSNISGNTAIRQLPANDSRLIRFLSFEQYGAISGGTVECSAAINACLNDARKYNLPIWSTGKYYINNIVDFSNVTASGFTLVGGASSPNSYCVLVNGSANIDNVNFEKVYLQHTNGDLKLTNFTFKKVGATAAVLSLNLTSEGSVTLQYGTFRQCNYGYLRQGDPLWGSALRFQHLKNLQFFDMNGDCIELNLGIKDRNTEVSDILVDNVNHTGKNLFWGIALGFAGKTPYGLDADDSSYMSDVSIKRVKVYGARQCLHFEKCRNIYLEDIEMYPDSTKSVNSGIDPAGIILYGSKDISIKDVKGKPDQASIKMIHTSWGVTDDAYICAERNILVRDVDVDGNIELNMSTNDVYNSYLRVYNVSCNVFAITGQASEFHVENVRCSNILLDFQPVTNTSKDQLRRHNRITATFKDIVSKDENQDCVCSIKNIAIDELTVQNCNFPFFKQSTSTITRGTPITKLDGIYHYDSEGFPNGYQFKVGDRIIDSTGKMYVVKQSGAVFSSYEKVRSAVCGQNYLVSYNMNWLSAYKTAGTRIRIPGAGENGTDLVCTVVRSSHVNNGMYRIILSDTIKTDIPDGTQILPENICKY